MKSSPYIIPVLNLAFFFQSVYQSESLQGNVFRFVSPIRPLNVSTQIIELPALNLMIILLEESSVTKRKLSTSQHSRQRATEKVIHIAWTEEGQHIEPNHCTMIMSKIITLPFTLIRHFVKLNKFV